jgi:capsular polysaccharide biosynthesis protein
MAVQYRASDLLTLMLRRWWVLLLGVVLGVGAAYGALQVVAPTYIATATQLVKGIPGQTTGANYVAAQFAVARAKSYPVFVYSSKVLDGVRKDLGDTYTDALLREQVSANNPVDTPLVNIVAEGGSPEEARELANSAAKHLATFIAEIETIDGKAPVVVSTAVEAEHPVSPSSPKPLLFCAMGAALGGTVGILTVLAWASLATRRKVVVEAGHSSPLATEPAS